jgi:hypothetical protein
MTGQANLGNWAIPSTVIPWWPQKMGQTSSHGATGTAKCRNRTHLGFWWAAMAGVLGSVGSCWVLLGCCSNAHLDPAIRVAEQKWEAKWLWASNV